MSEPATDTPDFIAQFDEHPFHKSLGITLEEARSGYSRILLTRNADTPSGIGGSVHGGVLATMVDIAMLAAVFADLDTKKVPAGTADLGISYLRQAQGDKIYATANVVKNGRQLASVEVDITDAEGTLCAKGRVLYAYRAQPDQQL